MNNKKINIVVLALFHLLVFTFPFAIKVIHHHETHYLNVHQSADGRQLSEAEKLCPICQFEFVSFIAGEHMAFGICQPVCLIKNCNPVQKVYKVPGTSYLLRAPPLV